MPRNVVVVGAGLTGLVTAFRLHRSGARVVVVDASDRVGGLLRSGRDDGWLVEWAANGFLDNAEATLALARDVGVESELVRAAPASAERFLVHRGRLVAAPSRPPQVLTTPLLTWGAKLRLLGEPRARGPPARDESVEDFVRRRFGEGVLHVADAMVKGVHGGDLRRLSLRHAFPQLAAMERDHGSILRALRARGRPPRPARLTSFRDGVETLPRVLATSLPEGAIRVGTRVERVRPRTGGFVVETDASPLEAERVVVALPPAATARVVEGARVPRTTAAPVAVVALGYPRERAPGARGFGYLAPDREGRFALGAVFESNLFEGRAPEGHVLVRALVGGARHPERAAFPDEALAEGVRRDLDALGITRGEPEPVFTRVVRPGAIPQLEVGHGAVLDEAARLELLHPGLHVGGAGWRSVAVNGLVAEAEALAGLVRE